MSLARALSKIVPSRSNAGCITCKYLSGLPAPDRAAFDTWLAEGHSVAQLWEVCLGEGLQISITGFRHHLTHHEVGKP